MVEELKMVEDMKSYAGAAAKDSIEIEQRKISSPDGKKNSKSLPSRAMDTRMSTTEDSEEPRPSDGRKCLSSARGRKRSKEYQKFKESKSKSPGGKGSSDRDPGDPANIDNLGLNEKTGKLRKHIFAAGHPYSKEVKVNTIENPPPVMVHRGLQVDQDVDRYDILLAVTDVKFDPKTGAPKTDGLRKIQEDDFPWVIVDQPTKCYCNNNENEVYNSPYLEVKDSQFIKVNHALGHWNTVSYFEGFPKTQLSE